MCRTNRRRRAVRLGSRCVLLLLSVCLLLSSAPCADVDVDASCDLCDQDDLIAGSAASCAQTSVLLLDCPATFPLTSQSFLPSRVSRPPIF